MPKSKGKNTDEGEGNVAKGLVDLGLKILSYLNDNNSRMHSRVISIH